MLFPVYFCKRKAEAACLEQEGIGASEVKALFALQEAAKPPSNLAAGAGSQRKAQAARSDCEGDGASDVKALFAL
ncbi:hypothetical protein [Bacillus wiedmannii]|uniref:hypothetical protein n=1 Tax=Bacillus wiedmannii TaxID=1890302 RepID=UPI0011556B5A|nr:hypothetical protein [Bacillus wiedmannii]